MIKHTNNSCQLGKRCETRTVARRCVTVTWTRSAYMFCEEPDPISDGVVRYGYWFLAHAYTKTPRTRTSRLFRHPLCSFISVFSQYSCAYFLKRKPQSRTRCFPEIVRKEAPTRSRIWPHVDSKSGEISRRIMPANWVRNCRG